MKKLNNKGFVLVETLIVATFVVTIFAVMYNNFYPLMGEYEKREAYDDVDGKYAAYWIKRIIQSDAVDPATVTNFTGSSYRLFSCDDVKSERTEIKDMCNRIVKETEIAKFSSGAPKIYLTNYQLHGSSGAFKDTVKASNDTDLFSSGFRDYLVFLPDYSKTGSLNNANYRVLIEFDRKNEDSTYPSYATIEVKK